MTGRLAPLNAFGHRLYVGLFRLDLARARLLGDQEGTMEDLLELARFIPDPDKAEKLLVEARTLAVAQGKRLEESRAGVGLARVAITREEFDLAVRLLEAELPSLRQLWESEPAVGRLVVPQRWSSPALLIYGLLKLGEASEKLGRSSQAAAAWEEALTLAASRKDDAHGAEAMMYLAAMYYREKRYEDARR